MVEFLFKIDYTFLTQSQIDLLSFLKYTQSLEIFKIHAAA
mgnify:CR=1 FL=1